jgi:hypothetical protein
MTKTTRPTVRIHDLSTNEIIDREMNDAEYEQYLNDQTAKAAADAAKEQAAAERAALLNRLGLTEDELKTILG